MVGPQEDNSSSLCIIDTAVRIRSRVSVKIGEMILEIDVIIDGRIIQHACDVEDACGKDAYEISIV